ncbi:hypothetical protein RAB80_015496 [Fusarium oxysporum f. sp. vasinfectum]|uniref:Uncharacterized protein n=1 Tax=Fusarium oxysporum f. sp. vasinfectum 25433 TaxID=1089449 RepID=X0L8P3_FUSOX|nr:hypothetical protein FOTG_14401 [Fusarium oxysporum f. sp. vasinfectum 25433]KAK2668116.1 hypothetical protein RAB80_015496 [Fusarium oxysporum f. sp. vasinfectum]KAK2926224.1 hypothetical protein FoTM2_014593 [Fusarium oxysporum f. sp. vasinfectum]
MAEKDRKVGASRIENNPPSIADLGKVFDEIAEERLGRRDPTSRRWQRKTWAPPIWTRKSEHFAILNRIDIKDLTCDARGQEAEALVMEIKVCEVEKERKKNKDKIVQIENDIRHVQGDVSAFDDRYKTHDAGFLQTREKEEELVNRLDTIDENQEEQKKQNEENMRRISEDLRCDVAKGLMQGINWD